MEFQKKLDIANVLTIVATVISLMLLFIYYANYVSLLEKQIISLDQKNYYLENRLNEMNIDWIEAYNLQDQAQYEFQKEVQSSLAQVNRKVEMIYSILLAD